MSETPLVTIASNYRRAHERSLKLMDDLSNEQLTWLPNPTAPSIGFHIGYMARWADQLLEMVSGPVSQLWKREGLANRWGLDSASLGYKETGIRIGGDMPVSMDLPRRDVLLDDVGMAFDAPN